MIKQPERYLHFRLFAINRSTLRYIISLFIMATFSLVASQFPGYYRHRMLQLETGLYGAQHAIITSIPSQSVAKLNEVIARNSDIREVGWLVTRGTWHLSQFSFANDISFGFMDPAARRIGRVRLLSGRWPENPDEVAVEQGVFAKLRLPAQLGTVISPHDTRSPQDSGESTVSIVGILADYSYQRVPLQESDQAQALPEIVYADSLLVAERTLPNAQIALLIRFHQSTDFTLSLENILSESDLSPVNCLVNTAVYRASGSLPRHGEIDARSNQEFNLQAEMDAYMQQQGTMRATIAGIAVLLAILCLVHAAISLFMIRSQEAKIYRLRLLGCGPSCMRKILLFFGLQHVLVPALAATFTATILIQLFRLFLTIESSADIQLFVLIWLLLVLSAQVIIITVGSKGLAMKPFADKPTQAGVNVQGTDNNKNRNTPRISRLELLMRRPYMFLVGRILPSQLASLILAVIALSLSVASLLYGFSYIAALQSTYNSRRFVADFFIFEQRSRFITDFEIPVQMKSGLNILDLQQLSETEGVRSILSFVSAPIVVQTRSEADSAAFQTLGMTQYNSRMRSESEFESYDKQKHQFGFAADDLLYRNSLKGIDESVFLALRPFLAAGNLTDPKLDSGEGVILIVDERHFNADILPIGHPVDISLLYLRTPLEQMPDTPDIMRLDLPMEIVAIVAIPPEEATLYNFFVLSTARFAWPAVNSRKYFPEMHASDIAINLETNASNQPVDASLQSIARLYPHMRIISRFIENQMKQTRLRDYLITMTSIIGFFILSTILTLISYIRHAVFSQHRFWGEMRLQGMNEKQAHRLYQLQSVYLSSLVVLGGSLTLLALRSMLTMLDPAGHEQTRWLWLTLTPWYLLPLFWLVVFLLFNTASRLIVRRFYNLPLSELTRHVE